MPRSETDPRVAKGAMITIEVSSVDDSLEKIAGNGGKILMPKTSIPGIGYSANFEDSEGNLVGIMENDHAAK